MVSSLRPGVCWWSSELLPHTGVPSLFVFIIYVLHSPLLCSLFVDTNLNFLFIVKQEAPLSKIVFLTPDTGVETCKFDQNCARHQVTAVRHGIWRQPNEFLSISTCLHFCLRVVCPPWTKASEDFIWCQHYQGLSDIIFTQLHSLTQKELPVPPLTCPRSNSWDWTPGLILFLCSTTVCDVGL